MPKNDFLFGLLDAEGSAKSSRGADGLDSCITVSSAETLSGSSSITSCRSGLASRNEALLDRLLDDWAKYGLGGARGRDELESGGLEGKFFARCSWNGMPRELLEEPIAPSLMSSCMS